jgi:hypothetical protein
LLDLIFGQWYAILEDYHGNRSRCRPKSLAFDKFANVLLSNILSTVRGLDNHRRPEFRFCRFLATGLDFGRPRPGRSWLSLWRWLTASKIRCAIVQPFFSAM